jgi:hypothetical protein
MSNSFDKERSIGQQGDRSEILVEDKKNQKRRVNPNAAARTRQDSRDTGSVTGKSKQLIAQERAKIIEASGTPRKQVTGPDGKIRIIPQKASYNRVESAHRVGSQENDRKSQKPPTGRPNHRQMDSKDQDQFERENRKKANNNIRIRKIPHHPEARDKL